MAADSEAALGTYLDALIEHRNLPEQDARRLFDQLFDGTLPESASAAFLVALRMKGESSAELAAAAESLRERMTPFPTSGSDVLDTCGTGGDGAGTFNVSTAVAFVAAGAGVRVVKHGNRAVSGRSGSADVLHALGLPAEAGPAWAARCLQQTGLAFCFAPHFHPTLTRLAELRRRLGVRTILNLLGPLANPARAAFQLIGVSRPVVLDAVAGAVSVLGTKHALVVCGAEGIDEVSLVGPTYIRETRGESVSAAEWNPDDFGLERCRTADLRAETVDESAKIILGVLDDRPGAPRRMVVANAAAALVAADRVATLRDGVNLADVTIRSGRARQILERLRGIPSLSEASDSPS